MPAASKCRNCYLAVSTSRASGILAVSRHWVAQSSMTRAVRWEQEQTVRIPLLQGRDIEIENT